MSNKREFKVEGLNHGGRILAAARKYGIAENDWLDLSTGLNPNGWSVPDVPARVWQSLPEDNDGLEQAACEYYGCDYCLPVAGSQAAIQLLPMLRTTSKVGIISPTYAEHEYNWKKAGHDVIQITESDADRQIAELDVLVVINPNNPTGKIIPGNTLLNWYQHLSTKGGWLIVDEAFMDVTPGNSLLASGINPGLIVLRSIGKFFGLAGIRCGFIISDYELLQRLANKLGPWSLTGPTRYIAKRLLADRKWQASTSKALIKSSKRLSDLLKEYNLSPSGGTALFQWVIHPMAKEIYEICAKQGILIRYYDDHSIRFGLPGNEEQWQRLRNTLKMLMDLILDKSEKDLLHA